MFFPKQDHGSRGLGVESTGSVENGIFDDLLDTGVWDSGFVAEGVVSAALFDGLGEGVG